MGPIGSMIVIAIRTRSPQINTLLTFTQTTQLKAVVITQTTNSGGCGEKERDGTQLPYVHTLVVSDPYERHFYGAVAHLRVGVAPW